VFENKRWKDTILIVYIIDFKTNGKIRVLINRFEDLVNEVDNFELQAKLNFAMSLQFNDRKEKSGEIDVGVTLRLKDVIEDTIREPEMWRIRRKGFKEGTDKR